MHDRCTSGSERRASSCPSSRANARRTFGAELYLDTDAQAEVARDDDQVVVTYRSLDGSRQVERFDYLLAATGRTPNVKGLGLEHTSLRLHGSGVPVSDRKTRQCGDIPIFIVGDASDEHPAAARGGRRRPDRRRQRGALSEREA